MSAESADIKTPFVRRGYQLSSISLVADEASKDVGKERVGQRGQNRCRDTLANDFSQPFLQVTHLERDSLVRDVPAKGACLRIGG